jgi:heme exporter protein A
MDIVLVAEGLSYERNKRVLFKRLAFQLYSGQILHIIGANGTGKTTLLQVLAGLLVPLNGDVSWHGVSIDKNTVHFKENLLYINHRLGMNTALTPVENLFLFLTRRGLIKIKTQQKALENIKQVLEKLDLNLHTNVLTAQLSMGQQRRLVLAKLLLIKADCWILDEPFTALDKKGVALIASLMEAQRYRGGMVIFTSHQSDYSLQADVKKIFLDTYRV